MNANKILLLLSILIFLAIFPYTKKVEIFKAKDVNWDILKNAKRFKQFNPSTFSFLQTFEFTDEILKLDRTYMSIKGFIKRHKHGDHEDIIITETVTDVCFMCNHDKHYNIISINSFVNNSDFNKIEDGIFVKIEGIFIINKTDKNHPVFLMKDVVLEAIIK